MPEERLRRLAAPVRRSSGCALIPSGLEQALLREVARWRPRRGADHPVEGLDRGVVVGPDRAGPVACSSPTAYAVRSLRLEQLAVVALRGPDRGRCRWRAGCGPSPPATGPRHSGMYVDAGSSSRGSPSAWAMPTRVLVTDFVTEKTSCACPGRRPSSTTPPATCRRARPGSRSTPPAPRPQPRAGQAVRGRSRGRGSHRRALTGRAPRHAVGRRASGVDGSLRRRCTPPAASATQGPGARRSPSRRATPRTAGRLRRRTPAPASAPRPAARVAPGPTSVGDPAPAGVAEGPCAQPFST